MSKNFRPSQNNVNPVPPVEENNTPEYTNGVVEAPNGLLAIRRTPKIADDNLHTVFNNDQEVVIDNDFKNDNWYRIIVDGEPFFCMKEFIKIV